MKNLLENNHLCKSVLFHAEFYPHVVMRSLMVAIEPFWPECSRVIQLGIIFATLKIEVLSQKYQCFSWLIVVDV